MFFFSFFVFVYVHLVENVPWAVRPKPASTESSLEIRPAITTCLPTVDTEWV